ncbi:MAG: DUF342 domain-containing protein [Anaerotignaceae bacterium]
MLDKENVENETLEKSILDDPVLKKMGLSSINELPTDEADKKTTVPRDKSAEAMIKEKLLEQSLYSTNGDEKKSMPQMDGISSSNIEKDEGQAAIVNILVDRDKMKAKIKLSAPGPNGKTLTEEDILKSLEEYGITHGIQEKYITRLAKFPVYGITFLVAEGIPPVDGTDGELICHFENKNKSEYDEKKDKDYKNLSNIHQVAKDELLCDIILPTEAVDGCDVYGTVIPGKKGKIVSSPNGNNTYLSEDKLQLFSACDGHAKRVGTKVSVQNVMTVENVDYATGNIKFLGDVTIKGDVREGFSVQSGGSIVIFGSVEENVILEAESDITIKKGVNGKGGRISANGILTVGYLQAAEVKIKQDIFVDSVINSNIECGGSIKASGRGGRIIGGFCKVNKDVRANQLGNESNIPTSIEIVGPYHLSSQKLELETSISQNDENIKKLDTIISLINSGKADGSPVENRKKVLQMMGVKRQLEAEITNLMAQVSLISSQINDHSEGRVYVEGTMHSNVHINIDGLMYHNSDVKYRCTVYKNDDKVGILQ